MGGGGATKVSRLLTDIARPSRRSVLRPNPSRLSKMFCLWFALSIISQSILRLNFWKVSDVLPKLLSQLQRKLPSKRRFNSGVDDQMFDHSGKHWPKFALNRLLFWQINCRQGHICRTPKPCMGYLLSSVYLFLHAEVLWCVSVRFLNDTSTFICEKITLF